MIEIEVAKFLHANALGIYSETLTTSNIFIAKIPSTPNSCICIYPTGGSPPDFKLGYDIKSFQIIVRGTKNPKTGSDVAEQIYSLLHGFGAGQLTEGGTWVVSCKSMQGGPAHIGIDANGRHEYSMNFEIEVRNKNSYRE